MKTIKIIIILTVISFLTTVPNKAEARDCSEYQLLSHEWNKCKMRLDVLGKLTGKSKKEKTVDSEKTADSKALIKSKTITKFNKKCKTLVDCVKASMKKE